MLSVVPLMNGGGLFETGAGGSAPKHVQQLVKENYLRWDSLGEFFALAASLRAPRRATPTTRGAQVLGRHPRPGDRHVPRRGQVARPASSARIDNRGSHFYLALYWAAGARRSRPTTPSSPRPSPRSPSTLRGNEETDRRGADRASRASPADIGGYYRPDDEKADGGHAAVDDVQRGARHALTQPGTARCLWSTRWAAAPR